MFNSTLRNKRVLHLAVHPIGHLGQILDQQGLGSSGDLAVGTKQGNVFLGQCQLGVFEGQFQPGIFEIGIQSRRTRFVVRSRPGSAACLEGSPLDIRCGGKHHRICRRAAVETARQSPHLLATAGLPSDHSRVSEYVYLFQLLGISRDIARGRKGAACQEGKSETHGGNFHLQLRGCKSPYPQKVNKRPTIRCPLRCCS